MIKRCLPALWSYRFYTNSAAISGRPRIGNEAGGDASQPAEFEGRARKAGGDEPASSRDPDVRALAAAYERSLIRDTKGGDLGLPAHLRELVALTMSLHQL